MVVNKTKKVQKYRSHTTHGGGHRKKRRGAGSRGGRGNAGTGKRAGQRKAGISRKLGSSGFTSHSRNKSLKAINLSYFTLERLEKLATAGKVKKSGDTYKVDLKKIGFDKVLGAGQLKAKLNLTARFYSVSAKEKIKNAGGIVSGEDSKSMPAKEANETTATAEVEEASE